MQINKVAVIGSGVMGASIAAHVANAGVPVLLLDIVPPATKLGELSTPSAESTGVAPRSERNDGVADHTIKEKNNSAKDNPNRNALAEGAVEKLLKANPSGFAHKRNAKLVSCGNIEDDIGKLAEVDWVVEAVIEKLEIKQDVYRKIDAVRRPGTVVSSNTSTLPLAALTNGMPDAFRKDFLITHFFNPPRFMPLLELVTSKENDQQTIAAIRNFADVKLGKGVVDCKDTPGFIANRIGCFWLIAGLVEAIKMGITVEEADAVMGKPLGIPKTGVFGLFDLIGIDLMPLIAKAMLAMLPKEDAFCKIYDEPELIKKMIAGGYTGRKGKGGFYRLVKDESGKKRKEVIDLKTGEYRPENKARLESVEAAKSGLASLFTHNDIGGRYAWKVMAQTLAYAASLVPEIADDIESVDAAMRTGYNWKYGPFELIDRMKADGLAGSAWFAGHLAPLDIKVPELIEKTGNQPLYKEEAGKLFYISTSGDYKIHEVPEGAWRLADIKRGSKPITKNASASLWDVGDGVACLELTSKMNSVDPEIISMAAKAVGIVGNDYKGLIIGSDADNFSVGANLGFILYASNLAAWDMIEDVLKSGQDSFMALKYAPFPVVGAASGMALGGGCEILLHCDAIQAHLESYVGLVEMGVGLIPGWGGCKEMLLRHNNARSEDRASLEPCPNAKSGDFAGGKQNNPGPMPGISKTFELIGLAKVSGSAEEMKDMRILRANGGISMNRKRLLADAKARCLAMAEGYKAPAPQTIRLPGTTAQAALAMGLEGLAATGKASKHDVVVATALGKVLSGDNTDITIEMTEQQLLDLERKHFMTLIRTPETLARVEYMLENGRPLKN